MATKKIKSALISVFSKDGLEEIVRELDLHGVKLYSTGGTQAFIEQLGIAVEAVENITSYPSILDGRVKTLHPKVFGGLLARREEAHLAQLEEYDIPELDMVIVDLYPFEETLASTDNEDEIIEKIDIGGISLIRAAAKNYKDVVVVPSKEEYTMIFDLLKNKEGATDLEDRKELARRAFKVSSHYDTAIFNYFNESAEDLVFKHSIQQSAVLRYGENPHQQGVFYGDLDEMFDKLSGKELSYNNLVDVDAAVNLMAEFKDGDPAFAVLKHTNACGVAVRPTLVEAWKAALAGDNVSAFGGILICNRSMDLETAQEIDQLFYEVLIAPDFKEDALAFLIKKKKRVLLKIKSFDVQKKSFKSLLNGVIEQDTDLKTEGKADFEVVTNTTPTDEQIENLLFANKCVKHLKSNTIVLAKNNQLIGMGCGQTSRVDALRQAILKAHHFGFDTTGAAMASDAFFPFPDCVEIAHEAGISAVIQPGGSIKDQLSVDFCNEHGIPMVKTGVRHFKH
ncbi:MAG: phosphoribosylaminoimidazolecarboxamide formyltransferase/IMP cyclohydrolase [Saprospiraceae bacterium]|jgi:phosphoribosylaminoimidazolecarboxamide formyltransferase/IMP cyclohydrolase